ncbi:hypothetical protein V5799_024206 [Amblyomma americanum]|uniref:Uncharacterized protein n=1 Tax=Amblyomma americanum TaxID=6943 RepID=A0AAQ4ED79_AMBAM
MAIKGCARLFDGIKYLRGETERKCAERYSLKRHGQSLQMRRSQVHLHHAVQVLHRRMRLRQVQEVRHRATPECSA